MAEEVEKKTLGGISFFQWMEEFLDFSKHGEISTWKMVEKLILIFFNTKNLIFVEIGWENFFKKISYW